MTLEFAHIVTCEGCKPRRYVRVPSPAQQEEWARSHTLTTGHQVTRGTAQLQGEDLR